MEIIIVLLLVSMIMYIILSKINKSKSYFFNSQLATRSLKSDKINSWLIDGFNELKISHYSKLKTAMLLICYNRDKYLERTLKSVLKLYNLPNPPSKPDLVISQDGNDKEVSKVIKDFIKENKEKIKTIHINHEVAKARDGYKRLAIHYGWALKQIFDELNYEQVIVIEDDLEFADDFLEFFYGLSDIMSEDKSIMCLSAWNDNGFPHNVENPKALYRTDFFPGLGWLMRKDFWDEIRNKWPKAYWDDCIRDNKIRKNRVCIYPEVSRSYTFGSKGTSFGSRANSPNSFYTKYLLNIKLNDKSVKWSEINYKPLLKNNYDMVIKEVVKESKEINIEDLSSILEKKSDNVEVYKIYYEDIRDYKRKLRKMKMFDSLNNGGGIGRGSYHSLSIKRNNNKLILLVPKHSTFYV